MGPEGDLVESRLARGCRCFGAFVDASLAGYGWVSIGPEWIGEIQLEIAPRQREGYIWNCVTMPLQRRKGVFRSLILGMSQVARDEGLDRIWIGSVAIPAERAVGPAGFRPALRFRTLTLGPWSVLQVTRAADRPLSAEACAVLSIRPGIYLRRSTRRRH